MLILAIVATILSLGVSVLIVFANGMSDSPSTPFQGGWIIAGCWLLTAVLYLAWYFG